MPDDMRVEPEMPVADVALKMALMLWRNSGMKDPTLSDQDFVKLVASCSLALQGRYALFDFRNWSSGVEASFDAGWSQPNGAAVAVDTR